jgi:hypothetical protein
MATEIKAVIDYKPRPWAVAVHHGIATHRFSVVVAHRGSGKTYLTTHSMVAEALECKEPDGRFLFISPYLKQARDTAWVYFKQATRSVPGVQYQESLLQVRLPNGAWICLYGADDPDALRGMHPHGLVVDEVKDMKPEVWSEIILPMLNAHNAWVVFIGTAKGLNLLSQIYFAAQKDPIWFAGLFTVDDTGVLTEEQINFARASMSERQFAAEMMCDFNAGSDSTLIPLDLARKASNRHLRPDQYGYAAKVLGVDPARLGDDRFVVIRRQGLVAWPPAISKGNDTERGISLVFREAEAWQPDAIFIDPGGNPGVYDGLKKTRWPVHAVDFGSGATDKRFQNKRAEIWYRMKEWLKEGGCIPPQQDIIADLCSTEYDHHNMRGRFQLESKEDIRKRGLPSPDIADALATTFAFPVAPRGLAMHGSTSKPVTQDWNPLAEEYR